MLLSTVAMLFGDFITLDVHAVYNGIIDLVVAVIVVLTIVEKWI